ncbi:hypothetical protein TL18_06540 [Methanobrevibacter sp. YE315]|uniref:hypothetical protein n=1 Tax=Methanobrevibacter sp. YE315 TaxID=1609968 RepID=UPI000764EC97|nr:hypothetical protein [Methanobrevibacter sp. YE315]AMD17707.1 hypothetical protein TL18_06540 [Methanobrevibacter sp. YE315]
MRQYDEIQNVNIFSLMLFILSITVVSAADLNDTDVDGQLIVNEGNYLEINENLSSQNHDNNELWGSDPGPGTFDDLQREINAAPKGFTLDLYRDYNGHYGSRIQLNKDLTIDGHGHKLNGLNEGGCSAFYSSS